MPKKLTSQERVDLARIQETINKYINTAVDALWRGETPTPSTLVIIEHSGTVLANMLKELGDR